MILFFGPIGAGKSMQGQMLGMHYGWPWVSTGKMFRETDDPEIQATIKSGSLVSDEQTYRLVEGVLSKQGADQLILDGFPRTLPQVEWLVAHQKDFGYSIDVAIVLDVTTEEILARTAARGRHDDSPETVEKRLAIYHAEVDPILAYLADNNVPIVRVNGIGKVGAIHDAVTDGISSYLGM